MKSNIPGLEEATKQLLRDTEKFWSKHSFDVGCYDTPVRITMKDTEPFRDKYRYVNPEKEAKAQEVIDQLERHKMITKTNSPYCSQPVWVWKKYPEKAETINQ